MLLGNFKILSLHFYFKVLGDIMVLPTVNFFKVDLILNN